MTPRKLFAIVAALVVLTWALAVLFAWRSMHGTAGVAAVSIGLNELIVETVVVLVLVWLGLRWWRFWQRRRRAQRRG
jgi:membrane protein DedA with SNARE-associated domain